MSQYKFEEIYLRGNRKKNLLICLIMVLVFLGIMLSGAMKEISEKGKNDAFLYNEPAISIESNSEQGVITTEQLAQIKKIPHILGVSDWKEERALPLNAKNVKEYSGKSIKEEKTVYENADKVVFLEELCVELNSRFRCEKNVYLSEGEFPSYENKGILIEERMAVSNGLKIGDSMSFKIDETGLVCNYKICGIYKVDSDFILSENNTEGADVYIHSPYNVIFIDRQYAFETMEGKESNDFVIEGGCQIYVDAYENIGYVAEQLRSILGNDFNFYNLSEDYMKTSGSIVTLMQQYAQIMLVVFMIVGSIVLLILFSLFAKQFDEEMGILLALGKKKKSILFQYMLIMLHMVVFSLIGSTLLYFLSSGFLLNAINEVLEKIVSSVNIGGVAISSYETPGLGLGFHMAISSTELYHIDNFLLIGGVALLLTVVSMFLPLYKMMTMNTKKILEQSTK
jgi:putative ABC transport system permease protein